MRVPRDINFREENWAKNKVLFNSVILWVRSTFPMKKVSKMGLYIPTRRYVNREEVNFKLCEIFLKNIKMCIKS